VTEYVLTLARSESDEHARIVMRVLVGPGGVKVTEFEVRPGTSGELGSGDVPAVDFTLLAKAFSPMPSTTAAETPAHEPESGELFAVADVSSSSPNAASSERNGRAYRKMPAPAQVLKVLREEGTVVAMAKRFGVPRHTAQGWLARIRRDS